MTGRRRRGVFEAIPRAAFARSGGPAYVDAVAAAAIGNGLAVAVFSALVVALYVDLGAGELALFAAVSAAGYVVENAVAAHGLRRLAEPVRRALAPGAGEEAAARGWEVAMGLPLALVRSPWLYVMGALGAGAAALVLATQLGLPAHEAAAALPVLALLYVSSAVLRYIGLELSMRPVLERLGERAAVAAPPPAARVSLHQRLLVTVPMVTWGAGVVVAGLVTEDSRELATLGWAGLAAVAVSAAISMWLSLVLADAVSGPVVDLRDATRRVRDGDLDTRVPVVCADETGELAASFNDMVAGLGERTRLREAFGAFVDPALIERILAEGADLAGEEIDVSILFLDVRGFTAYAEAAEAREVVATLNRLYEAVVPVVLRHGGHANKLIGDGLLAVFGAPDRHADHAARALAAAREIAGLAPGALGGDLGLGVGINSGRVVFGTIGGGGRRDFTVVGDAVNTAARVQAATRVTGDAILVTEATLRALGPTGESFEERPAAPLKGKAEPVRLYAPPDTATSEPETDQLEQ